MLEGGCHCRAVRYQVEGPTAHVVLCHCSDCRRHAGAPAVSWAAVKADQLDVTGDVATYASSEHGRRQFCGACGTGLFYINDVALPGLVDIQTATLDDPDAMPPGAQIQTADRLEWMNRIGELPAFERYPPG
jgi:hypothetical protein